MKNRGQRMNTYKHNYKPKNLPKTIQNKCNMFNEEPMWVSRMPHLGISIADIHENKELLRRIPFQIIVQQIFKLLQQVKALKDAEYIHGDIRQTNVMIHPHSGTMTIIDFDWLLPKTEFLHSYPLGFYSNPPESLIRQELDDNSRNTDRFFMNLVGDPDRRDLARKYIKYYLQLLVSDNFEIKTIHDLKPFLLDTMKVYQEKLMSKSRESVDDLLFETFDSYGLGFTLFELLDVVYPGRSETELNDSLSSRISNRGRPYSPTKLKQIASIVHNLKMMCIGLAQLSFRNRFTIEEAIDMFQAIPNIQTFIGCEDESCAFMG
jgi:serine/threonine protein kinase